MEMSSSFEVNQTVHNLHNVCVVYTGVGSLEVACARPLTRQMAP